jgi:hypothetical protein
MGLIEQLASVQPQEAWPTRLWCAKEAVSKLLGTGLQGRPRDFVARDAEGDGRLLIEHAPTGKQFVVYTAWIEEYIVAYTSADGVTGFADANGARTDVGASPVFDQVSGWPMNGPGGGVVDVAQPSLD